MSESQWTSVEEMKPFRDVESLSDEIWTRVASWPPLAKDTLGRQLVRAADSVGANLAEGDARYHYKDKLNFCYIARASLGETCYWIRRANARHLIMSEDSVSLLARYDSVRRWINTLITQRRRWLESVHEDTEPYQP